MWWEAIESSALMGKKESIDGYKHVNPADKLRKADRASPPRALFFPTLNRYLQLHGQAPRKTNATSWRMKSARRFSPSARILRFPRSLCRLLPTVSKCITRYCRCCSQRSKRSKAEKKARVTKCRRRFKSARVVILQYFYVTTWAGTRTLTMR